MHPRIHCLMVGHDWGSPDPALAVGPLDVSPEERTYQVIGWVEQCERCFTCRDVPGAPGADQDVIAEARHEDLLEWDDPVARAAMLAELEEAAEYVRRQIAEGRTRPWNELRREL